MDTPFVYDRYVTGKYFLGHSTERMILANLLKAGEHIAIYEPPKSGKMSLIQQTLYDLRDNGVHGCIRGYAECQDFGRFSC